MGVIKTRVSNIQQNTTNLLPYGVTAIIVVCYIRLCIYDSSILPSQESGPSVEMNVMLGWHIKQQTLCVRVLWKKIPL